MTATPTTLGDGQLAAGTAAIMMAPATGLTVLGNVTFSNDNSAGETISVYLVRSGGAPGPANLKIVAQFLAIGEAWVSPELAGMVLNLGDALYGFSTHGSVVAYTVNGAVFA